jgi:uncharacterized protein (TIGR04255 family)
MAKTVQPSVLPEVNEIALPHAPLVRVIAQMRFPLVVAVEKRDFVAAFQEAIRVSYPRLRQEQIQGLLVGPGGVSASEQERVWRFVDLKEQWRVTLSPQFLALETTAYESRAEFFRRWRGLVEVLAATVQPQEIDRVGVRYIDRMTGSALKDLARLIRPEVRGLTGTEGDEYVQHSLTESLFVFESTRLLARWGRLPANATVDPSAIEPVEEPSWILDLDMFSIGTRRFDVEEAARLGEDFARQIYAFFRWAVTEEFLKFYGGRL